MFLKISKGTNLLKKQILTPVHTPYNVSSSWFKLLQSEKKTKNPVEKGNDGLYVTRWACPWMFLISNLIVLTPSKFHTFYIGCHSHYLFTWKATYFIYRPKKTKTKQANYTINKITEIVCALWLAERSVCMRVCRHGCGIKMFCFLRANHASTNLKKFLSSKLDSYTNPQLRRRFS